MSIANRLLTTSASIIATFFVASCTPTKKFCG